MKIIKDGPTLDDTIVELSRKHQSISFAVAWASMGTRAFEAITGQREKIRKAVIGTQFYQTSPDVLDEFEGADNCRFQLQSNDKFNPKVYLFSSESSWDLLIGSANLSQGAMNGNSELMLQLTSDDSDPQFKGEIEQTIEQYWTNARVADTDEAQAYREQWIKRPALTKSAHQENESQQRRNITTMSWPRFYAAVKTDHYHGYKKRCRFLSKVQAEFAAEPTFANLGLSVRKAIAGLPNQWSDTWSWFGSMKGAGNYHKAINTNNPHLSNALDHIPLSGEVTRENFLAYVREFKLAFPQGRDGIAGASRLLALKRPDVFVCLNNKNQAQLCRDFGISVIGKNYERYWDDIIIRIQQLDWWKAPPPELEKENLVWQYRTAMLDAILQDH